MSKGDEYAKVMAGILVYMYEQGAIGLKQTVLLAAIEERFELQRAEAQSVMKLLEEQGSVERVVGPSYRLTGRGFEEAGQLSKTKNSTWVRGAAR